MQESKKGEHIEALDGRVCRGRSVVPFARSLQGKVLDKEEEDADNVVLTLKKEEPRKQVLTP